MSNELNTFEEMSKFEKTLLSLLSVSINIFVFIYFGKKFVINGSCPGIINSWDEANVLIILKPFNISSRAGIGAAIKVILFLL